MAVSSAGPTHSRKRKRSGEVTSRAFSHVGDHLGGVDFEAGLLFSNQVFHVPLQRLHPLHRVKEGWQEMHSFRSSHQPEVQERLTCFQHLYSEKCPEKTEKEKKPYIPPNKHYPLIQRKGMCMPLHLPHVMVDQHRSSYPCPFFLFVCLENAHPPCLRTSPTRMSSSQTRKMQCTWHSSLPTA